MKHLLSTKDLSRDDAVELLDIAEEMTQVSAREVKKLPVLRGRTVVNLFFEDSTRTRISFEAAAKRLSADVLNFSAKGSSVSKGESLQDTIQTLGAMGADAIVVRHPGSGVRSLPALRSSRYMVMSRLPTISGTSTPGSICPMRSARRCASGTPRVGIPRRTRFCAPLFASMISWAMRESARAISLASRTVRVRMTPPSPPHGTVVKGGFMTSIPKACL